MTYAPADRLGTAHIPGVATVHRREAWQDPLWPVKGPLDDVSNNDTAVIHYPWADVPDGDVTDLYDVAQFLRRVQHAYAKPKAEGGRGYSIGYLWAVDWLGGVWQLRGWEFQSAANSAHNDHTLPILLLVDWDGMCTDLAAASVRAVIAEGQRRSGRDFVIKGHGQLRIDSGVGTATSCPGVGLRTQISAGVFTPTPPPPPVPVPPITDEDDMAAYIAEPPPERAGKPFLYVSSSVRPATTFDIQDGVPRRRMVDIPAEYRVGQYDALHRSAGLG